MRRTIPLAEAKHKLSAIVQEVNETYERIVITKNGTDAAVLLSADEYEGLLETLDLRAHPDEEQAILRSQKQARKGQTIALSTLKKKLALS
ncbi:MAG: type II toxin-antitoxin system prevent-host-death family antitoxin [Nitrospirales bacterium]|nr:type II toxin-antitoxin system prevent-host-death family antitoxin [Nitrospirales bacterium]